MFDSNLCNDNKPAVQKYWLQCLTQSEKSFYSPFDAIFPMKKGVQMFRLIFEVIGKTELISLFKVQDYLFSYIYVKFSTVNCVHPFAIRHHLVKTKKATH